MGGFLGSVSRELVSHVWAPPAPWDWLPILAVNVVACLLIGWLYGRQRRVHPHLMHFAAVGFCGGFSTFSHFTDQTLALMQAGELGLALGNVGASIILGLGAALLGERLSPDSRPPPEQREVNDVASTQAGQR